MVKGFELSVLALALACACTGLQAVQVQQKEPPSGPELTSGLGWRDCKSNMMLICNSTQQISDIIRAVRRTLSEQVYIIRATRNGFLSHNNFSCPISSPNTGAAQTLVLDLTNLKDVISITDDTVTVQAGISFAELNKALFDKKLSLPGMIIVPNLADMSLGGALATAAHGSSIVGPASIAPYIIEAVLVDGKGEIHTLQRPGELLEGSLGLMGIVTQLTLEVVPARKVAVKTLQEEDQRLVNDLKEIIENSAAVALDVTWSPAAGFYTARVWHETEADAKGEAVNTWMHAPSAWVEKAAKRLTLDQSDLHDKGGVLCDLMGVITDLPHFGQPQQEPLVDPASDIQGMAVGWANHMAGATCPEGVSCLWRNAKWTPYELSIGSEDFAEWVKDVRSIMAYAQGCPSFLFTLRFVMASGALLSMQSGKQVVAIEISTHSSRTSLLPIKHQSLFEEIVQMTLCKYAARPHWAFGTNRMYLGNCFLRDTLGANYDEFEKQRERYDPDSLFVPPLFKAMVDRSVGHHYPGCAITGDCFCTEDTHCGPHHRCQSGKVFKQHRVCLAEAWINTDEL